MKYFLKIENLGHVSSLFDVQTGVRQGCPLAPFVFILAAEILAQNIIQSEKIHGIKINNQNSSREITIRQFADDTTFFVQSEIDIREILSRLKEFAIISGLVINEKKCKILPMNHIHNHNLHSIGFEIVDKIKIVGVVFSNKTSACNMKDNWESRIEKAKKILSKWLKIKLSYLGKILIIKTLILSQFTFLIQSITLPENILNEINTLCFRFLWRETDLTKKGWERVSREQMFKSKLAGGLEMISFSDFQNSFLISWAKKFLDDDDNNLFITSVFFQPIGGVLAFEGNLKSTEFQGIDLIKSEFWKKVLKIWLEKIKKANATITIRDPIHNNKNIKYKGKTIFHKQCIYKDICRISDFYQRGAFISYDTFCEILGPSAENLLIYKTLYNAINNVVTKENFKTDLTSLNVFTINNNDISNMSRKDIYNCLLNIDNLDKTFDFWKRKYDINVCVEHWRNIYESTKEPKLQTLQWKIINNIYPTNVLLNRIGLSRSEKCNFCKETDSIEHFFINCQQFGSFWRSVKNIIHSNLESQFVLTNKDILLGATKGNHKKITSKDLKVVNEILIIAKFSVSKYKVDTKQSLHIIFENELSLRGF